MEWSHHAFPAPNTGQRINGNPVFPRAGKACLEDKKDAVGELINMIGGNIKALLPAPCVLSVPLLALEGHAMQFPATKMVTHCQFDYQGKPFALSLFEREDKPFKERIKPE